MEQQQKDKKADEVSDSEKKELADCAPSLRPSSTNARKPLPASAAGNDVLHQLVDLALLRNGLLTGEALDKFLKRSVSLMQ